MQISIVGKGRIGSSVLDFCNRSDILVNNIIEIDDNIDDFNFQNDDFVVEFTSPSSCFENIKKLLNKNVNIVCGTTGWICDEKISTIKKQVQKNNSFFLYSENFSIYAMMLWSLTSYLSKVISNFEDSDICIQELHHILKKDAPSGTAMRAAKEIMSNMKTKKNVVVNKNGPLEKSDLSISCSRVGFNNSEHAIISDSHEDRFVISHITKDYRSFGNGAVKCGIVAKNKNKVGFFEPCDILNFLLEHE